VGFPIIEIVGTMDPPINAIFSWKFVAAPDMTDLPVLIEPHTLHPYFIPKMAGVYL
jgi:hypothetical protein